jgi:hypothetical protein
MPATTDGTEPYALSFMPCRAASQYQLVCPFMLYSLVPPLHHSSCDLGPLSSKIQVTWEHKQCHTMTVDLIVETAAK